MTNGKLPTWFIIKWLEKHPTHTANAPDVKGYWFPWTATTSDVAPGFVPRVVLRAIIAGCATASATIPHRSDWTIYNERGKRVRFKRKPELRKVGELGESERLDIGTWTNGRHLRVIATNNTSKTFDVFIRERKP